ncbi:MAG: CBS domain-containing protein [Pseudomonadales bacterium]|nr:CBS domain-containing protein [Pseudomonadales bacterium]
MSDDEEHLGWLERLSQVFILEPTSRRQLLETLRSAQERDLLDVEALSIIEGAMTVAEMQVREIMIPRSQVVFLKAEMAVQDILPLVIESGHSRFPVLGEKPNDVQGILLAKDLLPLAKKGRQKFVLKDALRPCNSVPESKRLNVLLQEFRANRNHMAIVLNEFGDISGIVTIEDVLEQIVGDIEDEYDLDEEEFIRQHDDGSYTVKALTPIEMFNEVFDASLSEEDTDTVGGLVIAEFGHLPERDEIVTIDEYEFRVLNADNRRVHLLQLVPADR